DILRRIDLDGKSRSTVADELGITPNLVKVRLHRARQALKRVLLISCCKSCHESGFMNCECGPEKMGDEPVFIKSTVTCGSNFRLKKGD
ncbi:MAG: sigma-70 family RNA polymerase sigma factor, partial [Nitrospira sp.]|nr:sigma-70 family RNA polymerase sigma factor [Nitrospira sp.]